MKKLFLPLLALHAFSIGSISNASADLASTVTANLGPTLDALFVNPVSTNNGVTYSPHVSDFCSAISTALGSADPSVCTSMISDVNFETSAFNDGTTDIIINLNGQSVLTLNLSGTDISLTAHLSALKSFYSAMIADQIAAGNSPTDRTEFIPASGDLKLSASQTASGVYDFALDVIGDISATFTEKGGDVYSIILPDGANAHLIRNDNLTNNTYLFALDHVVIDLPADFNPMGSAIVSSFDSLHLNLAASDDLSSAVLTQFKIGKLSVASGGSVMLTADTNGVTGSIQFLQGNSGGSFSVLSNSDLKLNTQFSNFLPTGIYHFAADATSTLSVSSMDSIPTNAFNKILGTKTYNVLSGVFSQFDIPTLQFQPVNPPNLKLVSLIGKNLTLAVPASLLGGDSGSYQAQINGLNIQGFTGDFSQGFNFHATSAMLGTLTLSNITDSTHTPLGTLSQTTAAELQILPTVQDDLIKGETLQLATNSSSLQITTTGMAWDTVNNILNNLLGTYPFSSPTDDFGDLNLTLSANTNVSIDASNGIPVNGYSVLNGTLTGTGTGNYSLSQLCEAGAGTCSLTP